MLSHLRLLEELRGRKAVFIFYDLARNFCQIKIASKKMAVHQIMTGDNSRAALIFFIDKAADSKTRV